MTHTRTVIPPMPAREASGPFAAHPNVAAKHEAAWARVMHARLAPQPQPEKPVMDAATRARRAAAASRAARTAAAQATLVSAFGSDEWLTVPQIAARLGITATATRSRLVKARDRGQAELSGRLRQYRWRIVRKSRQDRRPSE